MPKKLVFITIIAVCCALLMELAWGYFIFQRSSRYSLAVEQLIDHVGLLRRAAKTDGAPPAATAPPDLVRAPNPFMSYPTSASYRLHPFIDYSGVHVDTSIPAPVLDYFGFRNPDSSLYFGRKSDILVVMTGGSEAAGYSHATTIARHLERMLSERMGGNGKSVRVLNLSMNSYVLANEMNSFLHLAAKLEPDVVISHSGWNDMIYGALTIPPFKKLGFNYYAPSLNWLPRLYDLKEEKIFSKWRSNREGLDQVVPAYIANIGVYRKIVEATGSKFVLGLQGYNRDLAQDELHKVVHALMKELEGSVGQWDGQVIDFTGDTRMNFVDTVHSDEKSAKIIATQYADHVSDILR